jgi:uncharacterized protein
MARNRPPATNSIRIKNESMLSIHIGSIPEQGLDLDEKVDAAIFPSLDALSREGLVRFTRPVHISVHAALTGKTVQINGIVECGVSLPCSRCLEPFDLKIASDFSATAVPEIQTMIETAKAEEIELAADDMEVIVYLGDAIDLQDEIAQQVIMALPFKPLCREACKGLCSRCGADLNQAPCQCSSQDETNPFAALKTLSFPQKKE